MENLLENQAIIRDFHSIDAIRYEGFNDRILEEFERIIQNFYKLDVVASMKQFYIDLVDHLEHKNPHDLDITIWNTVLVNDLYKAYLRFGYRGTVADMMEAIVKLIEVGTEADVKAGYSTTKALNVIGWRYLFQSHAVDRWAHEELFNRIQPGPFLLQAPSFSFNAIFPDNYDTFAVEDGYSFTDWNTREGTLYLELFHETVVTENGELLAFTIKFADKDLNFLYDLNNGNLIGRLHHTVSDEEDSVVFTLPFIDSGYGLDKYILFYINNKYILKSDLRSAIIDNRIFSQPPISFSLKLPIKTSGNAIRNFTYYAACASGKEQVQLLA